MILGRPSRPSLMIGCGRCWRWLTGRCHLVLSDFSSRLQACRRCGFQQRSFHCDHPISCGCSPRLPGSAMLFDLSLDPFLAMFERYLQFGKLGIVRACADDIAFALARPSHLQLLFPVYSAAERFAGLMLKTKKCKVVLCNEFSEENCCHKALDYPTHFSMAGFRCCVLH